MWQVIARALPDADHLYLVGAWLTDRWELDVESRTETESLMRDAAEEFVAVTDAATSMATYLGGTTGCTRS